MPKYVDGFVIPMPKRNLKDYLALARLGAKLWKDHGALSYAECVGDDLGTTFGMGFPRMARLKANETVVFSFIVYRSKAHRDKVNAAVMKDPRMKEMMKEGEPTPFDPKRFAMGGFEVLVGW
jgi:uncharacterized protein YbaA (DUF1428 family)